MQGLLECRVVWVEVLSGGEVLGQGRVQLPVCCSEPHLIILGLDRIQTGGSPSVLGLNVITHGICCPFRTDVTDLGHKGARPGVHVQ